MNARQRVVALGLTAALSLVGYYEGTRTHAYSDPVGIATICSGHTAGVQMGDTASVSDCKEMAAADLLAANAGIDRCIHVPLTDGQRSAFADFVFNVGASAFCNSTLARKLNAGDYAGACAELSRWDKAGGHVLAGLQRRRAAERALCEASS